MRSGAFCLLLLWTAVAASGSGARKDGGKQRLSPIDEYIRDAGAQSAATQAAPGSLYSPGGFLGDPGRDLRANRVNDIVTIVVADRASAVTRGSTNTGRKSTAAASVSSLAGPVKDAGALANLAQLSGAQQLQGQGETTRETVLTTTVSARVTHVLPNGDLVVEGGKEIRINSEEQQVGIRGIARWSDVGPANTISSDRLAYLEIRVNGKGVVGDAIRRPNFLYRLLLGLLPF
jgi:flagellar L-ring protein precursor FlgH